MNSLTKMTDDLKARVHQEILRTGFALERRTGEYRSTNRRSGRAILTWLGLSEGRSKA